MESQRQVPIIIRDNCFSVNLLSYSLLVQLLGYSLYNWWGCRLKSGKGPWSTLWTKEPHTHRYLVLLTFTGPCITNIFAEYNQQDATFHTIYLFISVRCSIYFRWVFRPSSGAQNCTYGIRYLSDQYLMPYAQFWAPDDGRKNRLKHVEHLTEINKLWNVASCWLYSVNVPGTPLLV